LREQESATASDRRQHGKQPAAKSGVEPGTAVIPRHVMDTPMNKTKSSLHLQIEEIEDSSLFRFAIGNCQW
jgi:hypothetical protein